MKIEVEKVDFPYVTLTYGNVSFLFVWVSDKVKLVAKSHPSQIYDRGSMYIPHEAYQKIVKMAFAILKSRSKK